jgi:hypothetical protein
MCARHRLAATAIKLGSSRISHHHSQHSGAKCRQHTTRHTAQLAAPALPPGPTSLQEAMLRHLPHSQSQQREQREANRLSRWQLFL